MQQLPNRGQHPQWGVRPFFLEKIMSNDQNQYRLPYLGDDAKSRGIDERAWGVLLNITFPNANFAEAILGAHDLAKLKGLDLFSGHIAIVKQSRKVGGRWVDYETCWLTLKALIFIAHKTGQFAGVDSVKFGPSIEKTYHGSQFDRNGKNKETTRTVKFPEYAEATVYRFVNGQRCSFTDIVFFEEAVPMSQDLPTAIWSKKPALMLAKCAKSAVLRLAFAECDFSAEEMDGQPAILDIVSELSGHDEDETGLQADSEAANVSNDDEPVRAFPDENDFEAAIADFGAMPSGALKWIDRHLQSAVNLGAFDQAVESMHEALEARTHPLGETVFQSARSISEDSRGSVLWDYIWSADKHGGSAYEKAIANTNKQVDKKAVTRGTADAMITVLTFLEARKTA